MWPQPGSWPQPIALEPVAPPAPAAVGWLRPVVQEPLTQPAAIIAEPPTAIPAPRARRGVRLPGFRMLSTTLLGTVLFGLAILLTPVSQAFGGLQLLAVMSGSMEPTIAVGGIVGVKPVAASELQVGDVITFANQSSPDVLVTHRVVSLESRGGQTLLTTKGDANDTIDALTTAATRTVGRVEFTAPWLGFLMIWLASPLAKVGILVISVIGFALPSFKRAPAPAAAAPSSSVYSTESYRALEREIQDLLPRAS
jgi:signal peptidase